MTSGMNLKQIWHAALGELETRMSKHDYETWLKLTVPLSFDDNVFTVSTPNQFHRDWLDSKLKPTIVKVLTGVIGHTVEVRFVSNSRPRDTPSGRPEASNSGLPKRLVGYASSEAHVSVAKAFGRVGFCGEALRGVAVDQDFRMTLADLARQVAQNRDQGLAPSIVVASAGTVNTGAIDELAAIAAFCREQRLWLHVDAAFGGFAALLPAFHAPLAAMATMPRVARSLRAKVLRTERGEGYSLVGLKFSRPLVAASVPSKGLSRKLHSSV